MTRLYPAFITYAIQSSTERRLYDAFARELNDDWLVFHHVKWIGNDGLLQSQDKGYHQ